MADLVDRVVEVNEVEGNRSRDARRMETYGDQRRDYALPRRRHPVWGEIHVIGAVLPNHRCSVTLRTAWILWVQGNTFDGRYQIV